MENQNTFFPSPFQPLKPSSPCKSRPGFTTPNKLVSSHTMIDLSRYHRPGTPRDKLKHHASYAADSLDWEALSAHSPVNTVSSPRSFNPPAAPTFPCLADDQCSRRDEEMDELEYETSEDADCSPICPPTPSGPSVSEDDDDASTIGPGTYLREPSPSASLLFIPNSTNLQNLPTLMVENTKLLAESIISSAPAIAHTLCQYRLQIELWESMPGASAAVFHASALVNQCLIRTSRMLEPVWDRCVRRLMGFESQLLRADQTLASAKFESALKAGYPDALNQLYELSDQAFRIEGTLGELSQDLTMLYDWTDAYLTPALAELTPAPSDLLNAPTLPQADRRDFQVSALLDAHSYLCVELDKVASLVRLCQVSFGELASRGCEEIPMTLMKLGMGNCVDSAERKVIISIRRWFQESCIAIKPIREALAVLASISEPIKMQPTKRLEAPQ